MPRRGRGRSLVSGTIRTYTLVIGKARAAWCISDDCTKRNFYAPFLWRAQSGWLAFHRLDWGSVRYPRQYGCYTTTVFIAAGGLHPAFELYGQVMYCALVDAAVD